jgi:hypothetical protein
MHTLNNLFQARIYCSEDLDRIAFRLSPGYLQWFNPHRTPFLGNYDVNVLEVALQQQGKVCAEPAKKEAIFLA